MASQMYRLKWERPGKPRLIVWKIEEANGEVLYFDPEKQEWNQRSAAAFHDKFEPHHTENMRRKTEFERLFRRVEAK